ncbi:hypothetical protein [uncultured Dubosiella sp.]|uniref:hypothetical protein n=1 Tax=uncultured Dubosiella sp. TaxID=1937011 RepID=UPI0032B2F672
MYKSKRSQATDIPKEVKDAVWERDGGRCIFAGMHTLAPKLTLFHAAQAAWE